MKFHTFTTPATHMAAATRRLAHNEAARNVGALTDAQLANHLRSAAGGSRKYDAIDRYALLNVAASRLGNGMPA